jgi:hypothetical protein
MVALVVLGPDDQGESDWVEAHSIAEIGGLVRAGRTVAVTPAVLAGDDDEAAELTAASICAWAGARVFRTNRPEQVRLAIEMTDSLAGRRPPALTRRGLA